MAEGAGVEFTTSPAANPLSQRILPYLAWIHVARYVTRTAAHKQGATQRTRGRTL